MGLFRRRPTSTPTADRPSPDGRDATPPGGIPRPSEVEQLRADLMALQHRLDDVATERAALRGQVESLTERLEVPLPSPRPESTPAVERRDVDMLRAQVVRLSERVDTAGASGGEPTRELAGRLEAIEAWMVQSADDLAGRVHEVRDLLARATEDMTGRLDAVDVRITHVSAELVNQVSELGGEVDELTRRVDATPAPSPEAVATLDPAVLDELLAPIRDAQARLANEQARYQISFREDLAQLADRLRRT